MKTKRILLIITIILALLLPACSSRYKRNDKYTYGTLNNEGISSIYSLSEKPTASSFTDFSNNKSNGKTYIFYIAETKSGGVVAYGKGKYVYSPDKEDKTAVQNALIAEVMLNNVEKK